MFDKSRHTVFFKTPAQEAYFGNAYANAPQNFPHINYLNTDRRPHWAAFGSGVSQVKLTYCTHPHSGFLEIIVSERGAGKTQGKEAWATLPPQVVAKLAEMLVPAFVKRLQDALGTAEEGDALIEVARNAHRAEMQLSAQEATKQ